MRLLYGGVVCGLVALLYLQWRVFPVAAPPVPMPPAGGTSPGDAAVAPATPAFTFHLHNRETYAVISRRPLFSEARRPADPETPASGPLEGQGLEGLALSAVLIRGTRRTVLVRDLKSKETLRLALGEQVRGWTVSAIRPEGIRLSLGDRTSPLDLRVFPAPGPLAGEAKRGMAGVPPAGLRPHPARPALRRPPRPVPGRTPHP